MAGATCEEGQRIVRPNLMLGPDAMSRVYSDEDWEKVLSSHVHYGLVDYAALTKDREALERYYATLAVTGPTVTPEQFPTTDHAVAYFLNAYNALVLRAVLEHYPTSTIYDLNMPRLSRGYTYRVDGKDYTLGMIEREMLRRSKGDARVFFATSRAAMGTPRLISEPFRPETLDRQLAEAAAEALNDPTILRVDHSQQAIYVWQLILRERAAMVNYWKSRRAVQSGYLFNVLLELASPERRRTLQSAVGYEMKSIPFDRALNEWSGSVRAEAPDTEPSESSRVEPSP
jgi:hypothetical protein